MQRAQINTYPPGILRDKTMYDKFIHTPNYDKQNGPLCRLKSLVEKFIRINKDLIKVSKVFF